MKMSKCHLVNNLGVKFKYNHITSSLPANNAFERNLESSGFQPPLPKSAQLVRSFLFL